ncbi:MAG: hypothetical protein RBU30_10390 [Polyangia bacterium]|nr:hypothetical protein [Polyangia bacterium]
MTSPGPSRAKGAEGKGLGALVVVSEGREWPWAAKILEEVHKLRKVPDADFRFVESGIPEDPPEEELEGYLKRIRAGRKLIFKMNLAPAIERLDSVIQDLQAALRKHGASPGILRRLMQAYSYLGAAHQLNADSGSAQRAFAAMIAIEPRRGLSTKYFSEEVIAAFQRIKKSLPKTGVLRVNTDRPAFVFLNGRLAGVAPVVLKGIAPGEHIVELRRLGAVRVSRIVTVDEQSGATLKARIVDSPDQVELRKTIKAVNRELRRRNEPGPAMAALAKTLGVRHVVAVRANLDDGETSWYDARERKFTKRVRRISAVPGSPAAKVIAEAMKNPSPALDLQAGSGGAGGACEDSGDCPGGACVSGRCVSDTPIYKKWWFWTLIGVGVAAVAGGTAGLVLMPERPTIRISLGGL